MEVLWTAVPAVVVVFLGIYSGRLWADLKGADAIPDNAIHIEVTAKQFEWNFTYPGSDGELGTEDDFTARNRLTIPAERPVAVHLSSEDVIHSFFIPDFRVKQDALPGMTTTAWFEAAAPGEHEMGCAELCGLGHYRMRASVTVLSAGEYERWIEEESPEAVAGRGATEGEAGKG